MRLSLFLRSVYWKIAALLFLVFTIFLLIVSFEIKDDIVNKILLSTTNQQRVLNEDLVIRDSVLAKYVQMEKLDSISLQLIKGSKDSMETTKLFRDLVHMKLSNGSLEGNVLLDKSNLSWGDIGLLDYDSLKVVIKVENEKLLLILNNSRSMEEDQKLIKFGNYVSNQTSYKLKPRFDLLMLVLIVSLLLPAVLFYIIIHITKRAISD